MRYPSGLHIVFLLLLAFAVTLQSRAQVAYHNFNSNDGLPSNEVYTALQDHDGFLWFGTDHGVVKYNGYSFKTYTTADGLTDNTILSIKEDDEHNIWFLTLSGGIDYYDGRKFAPHPNNDTIRKLCSRRVPTSFEVLRHKQAWFGFVEIGVARIDSDKATLFKSDSSPFTSNTPVRIFMLRFANGKYIYTSKQGFDLPKIKDPAVVSFTTYDADTTYSRLNFNLLLTPAKELLISLENYLLYVDPEGHPHQHVIPRNLEILKLQTGEANNIWLLQKNNASYLIQFNKGSMNEVDSLTFLKSATSILTDRQGNQWVTTLDHGVYMVPNKKVRIFNRVKETATMKLSCINSNGKNLYVGLPEGKLLKIDAQFNPAIYYSTKQGNGPTPIANISFRLNGDPLPNLDTSFNWFYQIDHYRTAILQMDEQKFLLGLPSGFVVVSKDKKVLFASPKSGFSKRVTGICGLSGRKYLIGTYTGLYYYLPDDNNKIAEDPYFKNTRITAAKVLSDHLFGIATRGKGVVLSDGHKFYELNEGKGLVSDLAEDLYFENDSVLWVASFKGISKVYFSLNHDSLHTRIKNYTKEDGLCSNQVNGITGFNGFIWLATNEGLCYFAPADLSEEAVISPLYFGGITVNGIRRSIDSLVLKADENSILIEFNALYYKAIDGIRYRFRLKGTSPWKYTTLNYIQYYSLPPGEYRFEVAADDKDGKYRSEIHELKFTIQPRFVDTLFFRILLGLIVLVIIIIIVSSIFSFQKLKATNVIKLLQAEFKALNYQINPHFIFNVLNSIQYYILKKDTENAVHLLGSFSLLIRRIVNNSKQQYISIIEEIECLKEYMDLEKMRLDNKFDYTINIDSSIDVEEKNILPMIIQPLVENSIWHGIVPSSKPGIISIDFKKTDGMVICKVEDNGVGINAKVNDREKSQNNLSLAMKNVSERLKIISELNDTTWSIKTEDKSLSDPSETGTIVTIVFPAIKSKP